MVTFSTTNTPFICRIPLSVSNVTSYTFNYSILYSAGYTSFLSILQPHNSGATLSFINTNTAGTSINRICINGNPTTYTLTTNATNRTVTVSTLISGTIYKVGIIALN
jgi:hypothetical protein